MSRLFLFVFPGEQRTALDMQINAIRRNQASGMCFSIRSVMMSRMLIPVWTE